MAQEASYKIFIDENLITEISTSFFSINEFGEFILQFFESNPSGRICGTYSKQKFDINGSTDLYNFLEGLETKLKTEKEKTERLREIGKLGGRPASPNKKAKVISVRVSADSYEKIIADFAESRIGKFSDFTRDRLENRNEENRINITEIRKEIANQTNHFIRLKNFFSSGHFEHTEKAHFLSVLSEAIEENKKFRQWLGQCL